jgi:phosphomannomutase
MAIDRQQVSDVHFGTDGWRAIIGEGFTLESLAQVAAATAKAYLRLAGEACGGQGLSARPGTIVIGYDCRLDADRYAAFMAAIVAGYGFDVLLSDRYCPTPALCWTVAQREEAIGGIMLTASHNPAEYLGVKLRMADGGASPAWFTDIVEALLEERLPDGFTAAQEAFAAAGANPEAAGANPDAAGANPDAAGEQPAHTVYGVADIMSDYLAALAAAVDVDLIRQAGLSVVLDPMFGASRGYLAALLQAMGVRVVMVNGQADPTFAGLHPEPIPPWVNVGAAKVAELEYDACLVNDGDADRIGAVDGHGGYVTSHRLLSLLIAHLVEGRGQRGRVVRTSAGSNLLRRQCQRLGLTLTSKPIGFKWIYEEMLAGDVLIGGEESGGFGIPAHVRERDGLLMALLLVEMMAMRGLPLAGLVDEMLSQLGVLEYKRRDLTLSEAQSQAFLAAHVDVQGLDATPYSTLFAPLGEQVTEIERVDGIQVRFASDAWLLMRPSGTEPLVRVYAEAADMRRVDELLEVGVALAEGRLQLT